jgi:hypothetical protein
MESVEQPNDVHEQNTAISSSISLFGSRPKCPKYDLKPPDAIIPFLTLLVEQTSYGSVCVGDFNSCSCEQQIPNPPSGESTLSPEATFNTCGAAATPTVAGI